jgi:hypothetical protein
VVTDRQDYERKWSWCISVDFHDIRIDRPRSRKKSIDVRFHIDVGGVHIDMDPFYHHHHHHHMALQPNSGPGLPFGVS